jgi:CRP-like cAMP-binding protein
VESLRQFLNSISPLSLAQWQMAEDAFVKEELKRGQFFVREGEICQKIGFGEKGLCKLFYRVDGEERVMLFFQENQFMTDYFSFLTQTPSIRPVQAIEDTVVYSLSHIRLQKLYEADPVWQKIGRILAEQSYLFAVQRSNRLIHDDFDTRFLTFLREYPSLWHRVPQYLIASFLQMTPETLSRVKRRLMKKDPSAFPSIHPLPDQEQA